MPYDIYLDRMLLPVTPSKLNIKISNKNSTTTLINDGEINILKNAGLSDISFSALLPNTKYQFANYKEGFKTADYYLSKLENLKNSKKPFQFIVSRQISKDQKIFDTNMQVSIEDYEITENADNGTDVIVDIKLKQYRNYGTKTVTIVNNQNKTVSNIQTQRATNNTSKLPTTYKVLKNDTLWDIAKKYYDDGSKYTKIYNANKGIIKSQNMIYPGQNLTIPV